MFRRSISIVAVFILIIAIGCATGKKKPGTGGTNSAKKIEKTGHPQVPDGVTCYVCHKEDIPVYDFHKDYGKKCGECHDTNSWIAAKYSHPAWKLDAIHRTRCTRCHVEADNHDFAIYQCYGCHHEKKAAEKFHGELGFEEISDCIACHESADGH